MEKKMQDLLLEIEDLGFIGAGNVRLVNLPAFKALKEMAGDKYIVLPAPKPVEKVALPKPVLPKRKSK